jgi:hypothetical protein
MLERIRRNALLKTAVIAAVIILLLIPVYAFAQGELGGSGGPEGGSEGGDEKITYPDPMSDTAVQVEDLPDSKYGAESSGGLEAPQGQVITFPDPLRSDVSLDAFTAPPIAEEYGSNSSGGLSDPDVESITFPDPDKP